MLMCNDIIKLKAFVNKFKSENKLQMATILSCRLSRDSVLFFFRGNK